MSDVDIIHISHRWHKDSENDIFVDYNGEYGCILHIRDSGYSTSLMKLHDAGEWDTLEKNYHSTFSEAFLWLIKWRYYT